MKPAVLPRSFLWTCRRLHIQSTRFILVASVARQGMSLFETCRQRKPAKERSHKIVHNSVLGGGGLLFRNDDVANGRTSYGQLTVWLRKRFLISTSRFGTGQQNGSNQTPLGLHRVVEKIGGGHPIGTVFQSRKPVGLTWQGMPEAPIAHRILWLEGLEPGINNGGQVDSHARYIYIHGLGNEPTLGRPSSRGCIHLAAADLLPLFDLLPSGTLVWIGE